MRFGIAAGAMLIVGSAMGAEVISNWIGPFNGSWNSNGNWNPAGVPNNGGDDYIAIVQGSRGAPASAIVMSSVNITALTIGAGDRVILANGMLLGLGGLTNDGLLRSNSGASAMDLRLNVSSTWVGQGTVRFTNTQANRLYGGDASVRLTQAAGHTIEGSLQFGLNQLALTNNGVIDANTTQGIILDLTDSAAQVSDGVIQASQGGTMTFAGVSIDNSHGVIKAKEQSEVRFTGVCSVFGGEVSAEGSGVVRNADELMLDTITITGALNADDGTVTSLANACELFGPINLNSTGALTDLRFLTSPFMLSGRAVIHCSNTTANRVFGASSETRIVNGAGCTIRGSLQLGANQCGITNNGRVLVDVSSGVIIDVSDSEDFTNNGLLAVSGGDLIIEPGWFINNGVLEIGDGRTVIRNGGDIVQAAGELAVDGVLTIDGGELALNGGVLTGGGKVGAWVDQTGGEVNPGADGSPASLDIASYTQGAAATLAVDLNGTVRGIDYDVVNVSGTATLGGMLDVSFGSGFQTSPGDQFIVLEAGLLHGEFTKVAACDDFTVSYDRSLGHVILTVVGRRIFADLNCDHLVDGADLGVLLGAWNTDDEYADLNEDGVVEGADLGLLLEAWSI